MIFSMEILASAMTLFNKTEFSFSERGYDDKLITVFSVRLDGRFADVVEARFSYFLI